MTRLLLLLLLALAAGPLARAQPADDVARPAPEFTSSDPRDWLNAPPLRLAQYQGKVVLLEFWTFDCGNCQRSNPWLRGVAARLGPQGLRIIGVHTPEFEREKSRERLERRMQAEGITWPVMMDNDARYWTAIGNRFWPTFYLVDKRGRIRGALAGETRDGDFNARQLEAMIGELLAEPG